MSEAGSGAPRAPFKPPRMRRVEAIWNHPLYRRELAAVEGAERDRVFCRHGVAHLLDVARVAWIQVLEEGLPIPRDLVYAAALLHDIGRAEQYARGVEHDVAGERTAAAILADLGGDAGFSEGERAAILDAVRGHRAAGASGALARVIARADKVSRPCFSCPAAKACMWPEGKRNLEVRI